MVGLQSIQCLAAALGTNPNIIPRIQGSSKMKKLNLFFAVTAVLALSVLPMAKPAYAVCTGQFPAGWICGNSGGSQVVPSPKALTSILDRNFGAPSAQGTLLARGASTWGATATPILGIPGSVTGSLGYAGSSGGTVTVQALNNTGTWTFKWPTSAGTSGYVLATDGSGNTSWLAVTGTGTVTSVGLALPGIFTISGSPVTAAGTLTGTLATQVKNLVWAGPSTGANAAPTFRSLVGADLPNPAASTLGGIESLSAVTSKWINQISTSGVPSATQPNFNDLLGAVTLAQFPTQGSSTVLGNNSGGTAIPSGLTTSQVLDFIGTTQGDVLYRNGTIWTILAPGTNGQVFTSGGAAANPSWSTVSGTGTVTSIATGTGITGGTITTTGTLGLAAITNNTVLANVSGGSLAPSSTTPTLILDVIGATEGDILYRGVSAWLALAPGTSGQVLQTQGAGATPQWANAGAVSSITAGTGLTGGTITTSGTIAIDYTHANTWTGTNTFNSTVSGTGITSLFASPPPIGGTAPNTGEFSTLEVLSTGASLNIALLSTFGNGSSGSPVTSISPSVSITRTESHSLGTTSTNTDAALLVVSTANNTSTPSIEAQNTGISVAASQYGKGDVVAGFFSSAQNGTRIDGTHNGHAFGIFSYADASASDSHNVAIGQNSYVVNNTGVDAPTANVGQGNVGWTVGNMVQGDGTKLNTIGLYILAQTTASNWDTGIYIQDVKTNAITSPGFNVSAAGLLTLAPYGAALATYAHAPSRQLIEEGSTGAPVTAGNTPTIQISRIESIVDGTSSGDGSLGAALSVNAQTNNTQQLNGFKSSVVTNPSGAGTTNDNVAVYGSAVMSGNASQSHVGYGSFFVATATTVGNYAVAVGTGVFNSTGVDQPYSSGAFPNSTAMDVVSLGGNLSSAGIVFRPGGAQFDVGLGFYSGAIKTNYIAAPNFSVSVAGVITSAGQAGVSCASGTVNGATVVVVGGIVTHC